MQIEIMQAPLDAPNKFLGLDRLKEPVRLDGYHTVWTLTTQQRVVEERLLNELFAICGNSPGGWRPPDFKGHSLSVSDIVRLDSRLYYCDSVGWVLLQEGPDGVLLPTTPEA